jgi:hypothetical protein
MYFPFLRSSFGGAEGRYSVSRQTLRPAFAHNMTKEIDTISAAIMNPYRTIHGPETFVNYKRDRTFTNPHERSCAESLISRLKSKSHGTNGYANGATTSKRSKESTSFQYRSRPTGSFRSKRSSRETWDEASHVAISDAKTWYIPPAQNLSAKS